MKKLLLACIFTVIAYQFAQAQEYVYERVGQSVPEYIDVDGVRYARIPQKNEPYPQIYRSTPPKNYRLSSDIVTPAYIQKFASFRPYIGLDAGISTFDFGNLSNNLDLNNVIEDKYLNINFILGAKFNRYFGAELFFEQSGDETKSHETTYKYSLTTKYNAYGLDFLAFLPTTEQLEFFVGVGIGQYNFAVKTKVAVAQQTFLEQTDSSAFRFGIGTQCNLTDNLALRLMLRYIKMNEDYVVKSIKEITAGFRYAF